MGPLSAAPLSHLSAATSSVIALLVRLARLANKELEIGGKERPTEQEKEVIIQ